ncbi:MAG: HPr family phosphocarrier protein, partial [Clostridiales bacterium]|nr:HPr family phosphocarrier protein [Clostridiales bacterium]
MITREVIVKSSTGLHARPATLLVKKASSFKSDIT